MLDLCRLAIFINAEKTDIEIVTGILEIVGVTAEKSHLLLRREDQAHIIVAFVSVKMVCATLIQRDHVRSEPGFLFAFLFNRSDGSVARAGSLIARHAWFYRARDARRHIFDRHQHIQLQICGFDLIGLRFRVETVPQIIVLGVAHLLQCVRPDVVICDHEPICRNE